MLATTEVHLNGQGNALSLNPGEEILTDAWIKKQIAEFDILSREHISEDSFGFAKFVLDYISELSNAFKGAFYLLNEANEVPVYSLEATYACIPENFEQWEFEAGEGIVGQAVLSQKILFFDYIPPKQAEIEFSSLKVNLDAIMIIPFMFKGQVYGILELVYLKKPEKKFILLVEQLQRNIGAMLESITTNTKTRILLQETQAQKELLSTQEEELRQNLEELAAIQEALTIQNQEIDLAFKELEKNNNRILESITYARRIQQAILPSSERLSQYFAEHFVIYEPRDMVSGDFYWFGQINNKVYIAVVDCTGHGVPGAFMSMIGNTLLNQIVLEKKVLDPKSALSALHSHIRIALKQDTSENKDGMDISLCSIEKIKKTGTFKMVYAGAKTLMYYVKEGQLVKLKGDRNYIGGLSLQKKLLFNDQSFELSKGDSFYLSSDGFMDVCNPKRVRFGSNNLEKMIKEYAHRPMQEQGEIFSKRLLDYQQGTEQRDDITLLGFRL